MDFPIPLVFLPSVSLIIYAGYRYGRRKKTVGVSEVIVYDQEFKQIIEVIEHSGFDTHPHIALVTEPKDGRTTIMHSGIRCVHRRFARAVQSPGALLEPLQVIVRCCPIHWPRKFFKTRSNRTELSISNAVKIPEVRNVLYRAGISESIGS